MRVGIAQINVHVGAFEENTAAIIARIDEARRRGCDLVVFPELAIPGYAPMDLVWRHGFVDAGRQALGRIAAASRGIGVLVGGIASDEQAEGINRFDLSAVADGSGTSLYNAAYLIDDGRVVETVAKIHLPVYDIYAERRHFEPGPGAHVAVYRGRSIGIQICEDLWVDDGPTETQASLGAEWVINLSASPFYAGKDEIRRRLVRRRAIDNGVGILYANLVGGQDEVVFDGGSFAVSPSGEILFHAPFFTEGLFVIDLDAGSSPAAVPELDRATALRRAITLGIRDYVRKNGFEEVLFGLSGGVDSALVAALAAEALAADAVTAVYMPSEFSSPDSRTDAREIARRLGIEWQEIPIGTAHDAVRDFLPEPAEGLVDENLQPRLRGLVLMALANQRNALVLAPGNKSEIAVGYNTLYGDTVGALAPIADLYKDDVYQVAATFGDRIPERVLRKPPSAELRAGHRDENDLPPYSVLDPILRGLIEENRSRGELAAAGFPTAVVDDVLRRYYASEYKRRQLPPGIKLTPKAFGIGRRVPLTNAYRD